MIALRYFNACGAEPGAGLGEAHNPETHLIPLLFRAIATGEPIQIFGDDYATSDGTCIRDYIHVSDLATAHLAALDHLTGRRRVRRFQRRHRQGANRHGSAARRGRSHRQARAA